MNAMTGTLATRPVSMDDAPMDDVQRWPAFRRAARTTTGDKAAVKQARASLRSRFLAATDEQGLSENYPPFVAAGRRSWVYVARHPLAAATSVLAIARLPK